MSVDVEVIPLGTQSLDEVLAGWERRAATISLAYAAIATDFRAIEARRFRAEGPGWEPLAPSTVRERERKGYGGAHPILRRTGALQDSFTNPAAPHAVFRVEPEGFFVGSSDPVAHFHQTGGSVEGRPPRRALVELSTADEVRWVAILGRYLAHGEVGDVIVSSSSGPGGGAMKGPGR